MEVGAGDGQYGFLEQLVQPYCVCGRFCCDILCLARALRYYRLLLREPLHGRAVDQREAACYGLSGLLVVGVVCVRVRVDLDAWLACRFHQYPFSSRRFQVLY